MRPRVDTHRLRRHRGVAQVGAALSVAVGAFLASPAEAQWSLGPPELTVGDGEDPLVPFEDIVGVLIRGDLAYVADAGFRQIHAFALATGRHVATTGRRGQGPGEFQGLEWIGDCGGDSILATDGVLNRVSVYSLELDHLRTFRVESPEGNLSAIQCAGLGGYIGIIRHRDPLLSRGSGGIPQMEPYRSTFDVVFFTEDGSYRESVGPFPGRERYRSPSRVPNRYSDLPLLWGKTPVLGSSHWGFVLGTNDDWSLVKYDLDGIPLDTLALEEDRRVVSETHRAAYVQRRVRRDRDAGRPTSETRRYWREYPYPTHFPAYSKVVASDDGLVWVESFQVSYLEQRAPHWKVFDADGTLTATVDLPERFRLLWVGDTHVAGIMLDAFDVQTMEVRPIQRP